MKTYIISGESSYFIDNEIKKLTGDNASLIFNMNESSVEDLINEASFSSLFKDQKYIVVKNALFLNSTKKSDTNKAKKDNELLFNYLNNENEDTTIIFVLDKNPDMKKKTVKLISENGNLINLPKLTKTDQKNELKKILKEYKYSIDDISLWYIINNSLSNFDIAVMELDKLMLYYNNPCKIDYNVVVELVSKSMNDNIYELIDAIMERNLENSLANIQKLKLYKIEPILVILSLASELRKTYKVFLLEKNGNSYQDILNELEMRDFQFKKYKNYLTLYNEDELKADLLELSELDYICKSQNVDKEVLLVNFIMNHCE